MVVIPNFLNFDSQPRAGVGVSGFDRTSELELLAVGSISQTKNHECAIAALQYLPDARLTIVGTGELRPALERLASDLGVSNRLTWAGYVNDCTPYYRACDVLVHTALGETFGLVMFEAAEFGVPVISLDYPHARRIIPEYVVGTLSQPDPKSVAQSIGRLTQAAPTRHDYALAESRRRAKYGDDALVAAWSRLIKSLEP